MSHEGGIFDLLEMMGSRSRFVNSEVLKIGFIGFAVSVLCCGDRDSI